MADGNLDQFLNPESMMTPGAAGALTMMVTNALALNFDTHRALTGLVVSFLFGALVFVATRSLFKRCIYYVLNSLIIFCVALGTNAVGVTKLSSLELVASAYAQSDRSSQERLQALEAAVRLERERQEAERQGNLLAVKEIEAKQRALINQLEQLKAGSAKQQFFEPWIQRRN